MEITPRQKEVATLLATGMSNKEIGEQLGMSARTVKQHLGNIALRNGFSRVHRVRLARIYTETVQQLPEMPPKARAVACLTIEGLSNKETAARMGTTEQVIKNYLREVYDITGTWSRLELATRYAAV